MGAGRRDHAARACAARSITRRRSRTSSARTSAGRLADLGADLHHRLVQLGLDLAQDHRILLEDLRDVGLRSSRVSGSMIWYSSSMPMVRLGAFIVRLRAGMHERAVIGRRGPTHPPIRREWLGTADRARDLTVRSTTNVGTVLPPPAVTLSSAAVESRVRQPSIAAPSGRTARCRSSGRCRCSRAIGPGRVRLARDRRPAPARYSGSARAVRTAACPARLVHGPAQHDARPAVVVVRLEHQPVAVSGDRRAPGRSRPSRARSCRSSTTRVHGMCVAIACRSAGREQPGVALVRQHRQARLLVQHLAAERVHHADGAVPHRPDHRWSTPSRSTSSLISTRL